MVPRSERARPDDHRAGSALAHRLLEGLLPGLAGDEVPLVEERLDSPLLQPPRQFLDPGLVDAAVGWVRASTPGRGITSRVPGLPAGLAREGRDEVSTAACNPAGLGEFTARGDHSGSLWKVSVTDGAGGPNTGAQSDIVLSV